MNRPSRLRGLGLLAAIVSASLVLFAFAAPVGAAGPASLVKDINPNGSSFPAELTQVGNTLFFTANDGIHGVELWRSDGTAAGTRMVKDIRPYAKGSDPRDLTAVGGTLFFTAVDGRHGRELWKSDGTKAGTVLVKDINTHGKNSYCGNGIAVYSPVAVGSRLFFFDHCGGVWGTTLYVSDGTAAGTYWIDAPTAANHDWLFNDRAADTLGGRFYYVAETDAGSERLWVSNGKPSGTHLMAGSPSADRISFAPMHGRNLYFTTYGGEEQATQVRLWKTDGTAAGTKPLTTTGAFADLPNEAAYMANRLYLSDCSNLWKSDGTAGGTRVISNGSAKWLTAAGNLLFFERNEHLWRSDGTTVGTTDMGAIGAQSPRALVATGAVVCFAEADWDNATWTLWESNGATGGTYQVGAHAIYGDGFSTGEGPIGTAVGSTLFYSADGELWSYAP